MNLKRLRTRIGVPVALMAVVAFVLALPAGASALGLGETEEFSGTTKPLTLTEGSDGKVWYTSEGSTKISSATKAGVITEYSPGLTGAALSITAGPEGTVWFTEKTSKKIGFIKVSEPTTSLQEFAVTGEPEFITEGPDGNLWFTSTTKAIGRITPAGVVTEFTAGLNTGAIPISIIPGPDGNVWFGDNGTTTKAIGKITPSGTITETTVLAATSNRPHSIVFGSDGRIWFAAQASATEKIGAMTTGGEVTYYTTPTVPATLALNGFALGADGNVWARETSTPLNERQTIAVNATGGTYKLTFEGKQTESIAFNAECTTVEEQLGALSSIGGVANVKCIPAGSSRVIEFEGKFARTDVPLISCDGSALVNSESEPSCTVEQTAAAVPNRFYRFKPNGEYTLFLLEPRTVPTNLALVGTNGRMGTLVSGPDSSLWYTTMGDATFVSSPAIGKFGLGIVEGPELTVTKEGEGSGTVVSSPAGIECGGTCSAKFEENTIVTLTASPAAGSAFVSWKKCDAKAEYEPGKFTGVEGRKCTVKMSVAKTVGAKFSPTYDVTAKKDSGNTGLGSISGVACDANCTSATASFLVGKSVILKPKASKGSEFKGWIGCPEVVETVNCKASAAATAEAEFDAIPKFSLTVNKTGSGQGTVKSSPASISCGLTCSTQTSLFYKEASVVLTASVTAGKGSTFGGWTGAGCSGTGTCTVSMTEAKEVTAEFK